ncbi:MAG: putative 26S protease regulatory subunit 8 [Streblomastix strix]|uniref:Putative 26S protease regulatory subunit 8 n=1 Tax=Streblomastix strix TaxID=222440 RepID=A0A5J4W867_9EUKA|nr:MAG: putative 26S protease regulatory subunit 8 [Streblomastix strix]
MNPSVGLRNIKGRDRIISTLRETICASIEELNFFSQFGVSAPRSVILYGPPGTGKTVLARAVAQETSSKLITISGSDFGKSSEEQGTEILKKTFQQAKNNQPSLIFIDEIDSIFPSVSESSEFGGSGTENGLS